MSSKSALFSVACLRVITLLATITLLASRSMPSAGAESFSGAREPVRSEHTFAYGSLGTEFQITTTPLADRPAIAYNTQRNEYMVIWCSSGSSVMGRRVSRNGNLLGSEFAISISHCDPAVAYNSTNDQYLVVWSLAFSNGEEEVLGRIISWDGTPVGQAFVIWYWPQRVLTRPKVAWNSARNEYFVIWNAMAVGTDIPTDVSGTHVAAGGGLEGIAHHIQDYRPPPVNTYPYSPDADLKYSPSGDEYLVVMRWADLYQFRRQILLRRVLPDGTVSLNFSTISPQGDAQFPVVAIGMDRRVFVAYEDFDASLYQTRIEWSLIDASYRRTSGALSLWADPVYVGPPAVAAPSGASGEFLASWQMPTDLGNGIIANHCVFGESNDASCSPFIARISVDWSQNFVAAPALAAASEKYLIAYPAHLNSTGEQNIYGRLWSPPRLVFLPLIHK